MNTPEGTATRGKDQIKQWPDEIWQMIDNAVNDEITKSRMGAKFLPAVYVHKKRTTIDSDVVILPTNPQIDPSLSVAEAATTRIQQLNVQIRLSRAQVEAEGEHDAELSSQIAAKAAAKAPAADGLADTRRPHRASTAVSLGLQATKLLGVADDLIPFCGQLGVAFHPVFVNKLVQALDPNLLSNLDGGLLSILPSKSNTTMQPLAASDGPNAIQANVIQLPASQVVVINPVVSATASTSAQYFEASLNGIARGVAGLQGAGYNDTYALVLHTGAYADLHEALPTTLVQPVEPISHLVTSGIYGTSNLPPFPTVQGAAAPAAGAVTTGLPTHIRAPTAADPNHIEPLSSAASGLNIAAGTNVAFTGFLVSLSGNSMDIVRGLMDDGLDVCMTFNQKSASESYLFNLSQRLCLRLKDTSAVALLLFTDTKLAAPAAPPATP
jgi:hypothetical protein